MFFVDLSVDSNAGTGLTPYDFWGWNEFLNEISASGDISNQFKIKGSRDASYINTDWNFNRASSMEWWNDGEPWRLKVNSSYIFRLSGNIAKTINGMIIEGGTIQIGEQSSSSIYDIYNDCSIKCSLLIQLPPTHSGPTESIYFNNCVLETNTLSWDIQPLIINFQKSILKMTNFPTISAGGYSPRQIILQNNVSNKSLSDFSYVWGAGSDLGGNLFSQTIGTLPSWNNENLFDFNIFDGYGPSWVDSISIVSKTNCQFGWTPPTDYPFTPGNNLYNKDIDYIRANKKLLRPFDGITTPPNPGKNAPVYFGYETGLFGYMRNEYNTSGV